MNLTLEERPYSGKTFRPRPEIHLDPDSRLLIVATPWGARASARKVISRMTEYLAIASEDREVTSPFQRLSCLSAQANNLRIATLLANDALYRDDNRTEYKSGVELFAAYASGDEFVFVQAGNPQILLARPGRTLLPLGSQLDLSFDLSGEGDILPPLPGQMVGLDSSINMTINSFRARPKDKIVLLSHSWIPDSLFNLKYDELSLESLSQSLSHSLSLSIAKSDPDLAFWLGVLSIHQNEETT